MELFKLFGRIFIDSAEADKSISNTEKKAEGLGSKLESGIKTAGKWAKGLATAAGVAGGALLGVAMKAADTAGDIDDMAQRAGVTAEEFQKYAYAAKLSGMETATLESAMIKAQKSFADAREGSKGAAEAFARLGLGIENMSSNEAFDKVIMALADMEDETQRNAIANDIFGKSYAELAPMLNAGSEGINALKEEAVALGGVMSNESVEAGAEFGDMLDKTKTMIGGVFNSIGIQLLPLLMKFFQWVMDHMPQIQKVIETTFKAVEFVVSVSGKAFDAILPILKALYDWVSPYFPVIEELFVKTFEGIGQTVQSVIDLFSGLVEGIKIAIEWLKSWGEEDKRAEDFDPSDNINHSDGNKGSRNRVSGKNRVDGKHATGLAYVPFDGYVAEMHKGERIVTENDNTNLTALLSNIVSLVSNTKQASSQPISLTINLDSKIIARQIYDPLQKEAKIRGKVLTTGA
jgi:hypothetical protein